MRLQAFGGKVPPLLMLLAAAAVAQSGPTIIPESDPSITYSGTWYTNSETPNYGGLAYLTNSKGATAVITFNGTGITWFGVQDPYSGLAQVYLDGTPSVVDGYAPNTLYQQPLFTAQGLAPGTHTLSIQVMHQRDGETSGSWVWINYFAISNGNSVAGGTSAGTGRIEQDSPAITYKGNWYVNKNAAHSGGAAVLAMDVNSSATVSFTGSKIRWIAYRDQWSGIANIYLDGAKLGNVDTYSASEADQSVAFDSGTLTSGAHTLTIEVTGTHGSQSAGAWVWIDAFDIS